MRQMIRAGLAGALVLGAAWPLGARAQTVQLMYVQPLSQPAVQMVQQHLRQAGDYFGRIDGVWGPDSIAALQRFQQTHGLQPSGELNQATVASLGLDPDALLAGPGSVPVSAPAAMPTPRPQAVAAVQERLRSLGYYHGGVDGVWGPDTEQAITAFQQRNGLQPNGTLNPATVAALGLNQSWVYAGQ